MRQALTAGTLPAPRFRYSPVVRVGDLWQTAGLIALDPVTGVLEPGGPGAETAKILANLTGALPELGLSLDDLVIARIYTTRFDAFAEINAAWEAVFDSATAPPARTSLGVSALPLGATVEMEFTFRKAADVKAPQP
ncbi:MAG: RidA family protein [Azospirillaceae bacterium]